MSHPDDGTLESLLDGELEADERSRVEIHLSGCAACAARLAEARKFRLDADRLVEVLAVPSSPAPAKLASPGRGKVVRTLAWAASILLAVALGYWGRGAGPGQAVVLQEGDRPGGGPAAAPPAASTTAEAPVEAARPGALPRPEAKSPDKPASPEAVAGQVAATPPPPAAGRELQDARANELPMKAARQADEPTSAWRVISMEEAVRMLGGQIRLIDGLTPDRVESGPGTAVAGADPALPLVRIVYAAGGVILDEQRPVGHAGERQESASKAALGAAAPSVATTWQERGGIRFVITGSVSADSLRALGARVR
jgi:anti-sigma factor RsiW